MFLLRGDWEKKVGCRLSALTQPGGPWTEGGPIRVAATLPFKEHTVENFEEWVTCPKCGGDCNHLLGVEVRTGADNYAHTHQAEVGLSCPAPDPDAPLFARVKKIYEKTKHRSRELDTYLKFGCEQCQQLWLFCFEFHKGLVYYRTRPLNEPVSWPDDS